MITTPYTRIRSRDVGRGAFKRLIKRFPDGKYFEADGRQWFTVRVPEMEFEGTFWLAQSKGE